MTKPNKALWERAFTTDPQAVKPITGKQYNGNSPKPYWIVERLTDEFGPCGIGWGFSILNERFERFSDTDTLHVAVVKFWYELEGKRGELEQVGQTKATYTTSKGTFLIDEDAPKKSVTDALVKCASYLGFAGDIFSGRWDDSRYVQQAGQEWEARKKAAADSRPKAGMEEARLADWLDTINNAGPDEISSVAASAQKAAREAQDTVALQQIRAALLKKKNAAERAAA
jgi:hypothetical protein